MAVTAKFVADFSNFDAAVKKAEIELRQFEDGAAKVRASLERMSNALSGRRVIQEALLMAEAIERVGGVTKLTANELQRANAVMTEATAKMKALGQTAPASFKAVADATKTATTSGQGFTDMLGKASGLFASFGIGLSVGTVVGFGKALLADADALVKLSDKTGISTQWLQRFQVAGDDAGVSIETMTSGITQMQNRLATGDQSFVGALQKANINLAHFKSLDPAEQFVALSDAIATIPNPADRTAFAIATMGRAGAENLPVLVRGFDDVRNAAIGMSKDTIKVLDTLGDKFTALGRSGLAAGANIALGFLKATNEGYVFLNWLNQGGIEKALKKIRETPLGLAQPGQAGPMPVPDAGALAKLDQEVAAAMESTKRHTADLARAEAAAAKAIDDAWAALWDDLLKNVAKVETAVDRGAFKLLSFADAIKQIPVGAIGGVEPVIAGFGQLDTILVKDLLHAQQLGVEFDKFGRRVSLLIQPPKVSGFEKFFGQIRDFFTTGAKSIGIGFLEGIGNSILQGGLNLIVGGVTKLFGKIFGPSEGEKTNRMRDADDFLKSLGKTLPEIAEKARLAGINIQGVLQAKTVEAYRKEIDKLKEALDFQAGALSELAAAEEEYHFTATKGAEDLYKKYRLLTGAGYDQVTVLERQADAWNSLIKDALRFGTVLPSELKPIIQQLLDMGALTDENGDKLTDISQLRFADVGSSMAAAWQKSAEAVEKLVAVVMLSLGFALDETQRKLLGIADQIQNMPQFPNGSYPTRNGPQPYPDTMNLTGRALGGPGAAQTAVHTIINLDGRQIASVVSQHQLTNIRNRRPAKAA